MRAAPLLGMALLALAPAGTVGQTMDDQIYWKVLADELEYAPGPADRPVAFGVSFWIGGDYNRMWLKAEGDRATVGSGGELEAQLLYSRLIAPFWELQGGLGVETVSGEGSTRTRGLAILGLEGLAPYWFEVEPQILVSHEGDIAFALNASYELLFTQRLVLEPELEGSVALQDAPEFGVGSGLSNVSLAARVRYELMREFAPYIGLVWGRRFGATADLARAAGEDPEETVLVAGLRVWY